MDRSQLRKLSKLYATGELEQGEYRRLRGELIDGIVGGGIGIVREPSPRPPTQDEPTAASETAAKRSLTPAYVIIGLVVVSAGVWLVVPEPEPEPPPSVVSNASTPMITSAPVAPGPGERLIEELLADDDWSEGRLSTFELAWSTLTEAERKEAKGSRMYVRLHDAIVQEINAQQALAALDPGGAATDAARRAFALGQFLEMSLAPLALGSASPQVATSEDASRPLAIGGGSPPAAATEPAGPSVAPTEESSPQGETTGVDPVPPAPVSTAPVAEIYTLQLYALSNLENAQRVLADHPDLDLELYALDDAGPRYRIVYGRYASKLEASEAFERLPSSLREGQAEPTIRSVGKVGGTDHSSAAAADSSAYRRWVGAQRDDQFTIELFTVDGRASAAEQLVLDYPELDLKIRPTPSASTFHILYGVFESREQAEAAFEALPVAITRQARGPVVKSFAELRR
jgi:septal ring-binding cell division protein DamX